MNHQREFDMFIENFWNNVGLMIQKFKIQWEIDKTELTIKHYLHLLNLKPFFYCKNFRGLHNNIASTKKLFHKNEVSKGNRLSICAILSKNSFTKPYNKPW